MPRLHRHAFAVLLSATMLAAPLRATADAGPVVRSGVQAEAFVDGQRVGRSALTLRIVHGPVLAADNTAVAYSHCDGCETVAASLQVVVARGDVTDVKVTNQAVAVNEACTDCRALAVARQLIVVTDQDIRNSKVFREIAELRLSLHRMVYDGRPLVDLQADIDALMARVTQAVLDALQESTPDRVRSPRCDRRSLGDVDRSSRPGAEADAEPSGADRSDDDPGGADGSASGAVDVQP
jgi:hypothetical protein